MYIENNSLVSILESSQIFRLFSRPVYFSTYILLEIIVEKGIFIRFFFWIFPFLILVFAQKGTDFT